MAVDSAEKRRSAAGAGFFVVGPAVTPNVSKDVEWRQQVGWGYSGIAPGAPVVPPVVTVFGKGTGSFSIGGSGGQITITGSGGKSSIGGNR